MPDACAAFLIFTGLHPGGLVGDHLAEIRAADAAGVCVVIAPDAVMQSADTLWLGADRVCVYPTARFDFHGPSLWGQPLPRDRYEHWVAVMAAQYPGMLGLWFETEGHLDVTRISGAWLVDNGIVRGCE